MSERIYCDSCTVELSERSRNRICVETKDVRGKQTRRYYDACSTCLEGFSRITKPAHWIASVSETNEA